jgi:hypothetical protein
MLSRNGRILGLHSLHSSLRLIPRLCFLRLRVFGQPLPTLDHLIHTTLVDPKLEGDLLLGHVSGAMKLEDLAGELRRHLASGYSPGRSDRPGLLLLLAHLLQDGQGHVHALGAQGFFELLQRSQKRDS